MEGKAFIGGLVGGCTGVLASHSLDTVRVVYQENNYTSLLKCTKDIYKRDGLTGFYRGIKPPLIGIGLEKCIVFGCYDNVKNAGTFDNFYSNVFAAGVTSGLACTTIVTPVEKVKVMLQNRQIVTAKLLMKQGGIKALYNGWTATLFREVPGYGIYFCTYEYLKANTTNLTPLHCFIYGSLSGFSAWLFIYPSDPIKTKMQNQGLGFMPSFRAVLKEHGVRGFYRGFSLGLMRSLPMHGGVFLGYELFMKMV